MASWTDIRRAARGRASALRAEYGGASAQSMLAAAQAATGIQCVALAADDPLLEGANAVYDPELMRIWFSSNTEVSLAALHQAHEFAHHWLEHPPHRACSEEDLDIEEPEEPVPVGVRRVAGYGPAERQEREANVFAREFLLPTDMLREWTLRDGLGASAIAERVGVPTSVVQHQLAHALLVSDLWRGDPTDAGISAKTLRDQSGVIESSDAVNILPVSALDSSQTIAANVERGPTLVEAGPGTGKTRTLVARILTVLERGTPPEEILALTFSNKAAQEMRDRVALVAPEAAQKLWIGTFHQFGLELLRKYWAEALLPPNPVIVDPVDAMFLLEEHLPSLELSHYQYLPEPTMYLKPLLATISRAKDELIGPNEFAAMATRMRARAANADEIEAAEAAAEVAHVYAVYQEQLDALGLLDFGDLIARAAALLANDTTGVRAAVRRKTTQVLVDEYQDVNHASTRLLQQVAGDGAGLWVVGDARQSIYRFRGAAPRNMQEFGTDFPGARTFSLGRNYRSQPPIVSVVSAYAVEMPTLPGAPAAGWEADRSLTDGAVQMEISATAQAEADGIAREIRRHCTRGLTFADQAVLCRSHTNLARITNRLERAGIPVLYLGDLFERPEIRDLLALLSLACEGDGSALVRVARFPEYQVPLADVKILLAHIKESTTPFPRALSVAATLAGLSVEGRAGLARLEGHLDGLCYGSEPWTLLSRYLFDRSNYLAPLVNSESPRSKQSRLAIYQFLQFAYDQRRGEAIPPIVSDGLGEVSKPYADPKRVFLRFVRRLAMLGDDTQLRQVPEWASEIDAVRLLTVHGSKGLEFPVVFVPTLATSKFPLSYRGQRCPPPPELLGLDYDPKAEHQREEECLLFVALSRARDVLCLSRAIQYGKVKNKACVFLARLDRLLIPSSTSTTVTWPATELGTADGYGDPSVTDPDTVGIPDPLPIYTERALDTYLTCPRKYFYERVLDLPSGRDDTAYVEMHGCVYTVLRWAVDEVAAGRPASVTEAQTRLEDAWGAHGPHDHPYALMYRSAADQLVARALDHLAARQGPTDRPDWTVTLRHGRVTISPDHVERVEENGIETTVVRRLRTGRPSKTETTKRIYALLRAGAQHAYPGTIPRIEIAFLATGTVEPVSAKEETFASRVAEYNDAIAGVLAGDFRATPDDHLCPRCPHYFICPMAEDA